MKTVKEQIINGLTWFKEKIDSIFVKSANVVNNCASTSTDYPLSAAQGKNLQDQITSLNSNLMNVETILKNCDCLDLNLHQGIYWLDPKNNLTNSPFTTSYGWLMVFKNIRVAFRYSDGLMIGNMYANRAWCGWKHWNSNENEQNHGHDSRYILQSNFVYIVLNFKNGRATIPFSAVNKTSTPTRLLITPVTTPSTSSYQQLMYSYCIEESKDNIVILGTNNGGLINSYFAVTILAL